MVTYDSKGNIKTDKTIDLTKEQRLARAKSEVTTDNTGKSYLTKAEADKADGVVAQPGSSSMGQASQPQIMLPSATAQFNAQPTAQQQQMKQNEQLSKNPFFSIEGQKERLGNVANVIGTALNPFSKDTISATTQNGVLNKGAELIANNPLSAAAALTGIAGLSKSMLSAATTKTAATAISQAAAGAIPENALMAYATTGSTIATNTAVAAKTTSLLGGILRKVGARLVTPEGIMAVLGSYPFAGFIKEEALQTLSFSTTKALESGDMAAADIAIAQQEELLNPSLWKEILAAVPFVNVASSLHDFYKAATTKLEQDKTARANYEIKQQEKIQKEQEETAKYEKIAQDKQAAEEKKRADDEAYYAGLEEKRLAAKEAERKSDEEYYANIIKQNEDRKAQQSLEETQAYQSYIDSGDQEPYDPEKYTKSKLKFGIV